MWLAVGLAACPPKVGEPLNRLKPVTPGLPDIRVLPLTELICTLVGIP